MLKEERQTLILKLVEERGYVSLQELMDYTGSSESTIRADLIELSSMGALIRLRGGAQCVDAPSLSFEPTMEDKFGIEVEAKKAIAAYAATLVKDHSVIYIDAGTSTYYLAEAISAKDVKIMTNSMHIARPLCKKGYQVYVTGGEFKQTTDVYIGPMTREIISKFNFDMGFFGVNAIDLEQGLSTPDFEEAVVKKTAIAQCSRVYFLADHTKLGSKTSVNFHPFVGEEIITDKINNPLFLDQGIKEVGQ